MKHARLIWLAFLTRSEKRVRAGLLTGCRGGLQTPAGAVALERNGPQNLASTLAPVYWIVLSGAAVASPPTP